MRFIQPDIYDRIFRSFSAKRPKIGLVLSGGVARGIAHLGVLQVLEEQQIPIDIIAGTSSGAICGGIFASGVTAEFMAEVAVNLQWRTFAGLKFSYQGVVSSEKIEKFIAQYVQVENIEDLPIPFAAVATDLMSGEKVTFDRGNLAKAIRASASFPGIFAPMHWQDHTYIDGAISSNLPVEIVRAMGAEVVIAVDVIPDTIFTDIPTHIVKVLDRVYDLALIHQSLHKYADVDVLIRPLKTHYEPFDLGSSAELIQLGRKATEQELGKIKKLIWNSE